VSRLVAVVPKVFLRIRACRVSGLAAPGVSGRVGGPGRVPTELDQARAAQPEAVAAARVRSASISIEDLHAVARRARAAAEAAGELPLPRGPVHADIPDSLRIAAGEDLASGAYQRAVKEAVAGDPDLAQG